MSAWEKTGDLLQKENEIPFWSILGPVSLLFTFALSAKSSIPFDLLFLALTGLFLTARWQKRGCVYALLLLVAGSAIRHCFLPSSHLWNLGLEASLGCAFVVTALAFDHGLAFIQSLTAEIEAVAGTVKNLEEELSRSEEESALLQEALQEKAAAAQKELEELEAEHSSILILNEVLRKTAARQTEEKDSLAEIAMDQERRMAQLKLETSSLEKELGRLRASDALAIENRGLQKELNAARIEREQTHLINETLARLHAKEHQKVREAQEEIFKAQEEARLSKDELSFAKSEVEMLTAHMERVASEREQVRMALEEAKEVQIERNFLRERLESAEREVAVLRETQPQEKDWAAKESELAQRIALFEQAKVDKKAQLQAEKSAFMQQIAALEQAKADQVAQIQAERAALVQRIALLEQAKAESDAQGQRMSELEVQKEAAKAEAEKAHLREQIGFLQEKMQSLAQIEPLFKQLKNQFDEKNKVLHQTRSDLFKADTELKTLHIEKEQSAQFIPEEIIQLDEELVRLEEENQELQDLVSVLSGQQIDSDAAKRKKKVKKAPPPEEQLLF